MTDGEENRISDKPAVNEGFPMKEWTVEIYILDQEGKEKPARCFTKAVYHLHPSFANPVQSTSLLEAKISKPGHGHFANPVGSLLGAAL